MYKTYAILKDYFGERLHMNYTDTDAFIMSIESDDLYVELKSQPQLRDLIDFYSTPANHPSGVGEPNDPRSGVVGYFKDECSENIITEFVALKPKAYSFTTCAPTLYDPAHPDAPAPVIKSKQVAMGIARSTIKQKLQHETYLEMFREGELQRLPNRAIRSKLHQVYSIEVQKRGLHPFDDKKYLLANLEDGSPNSFTHAIGHCKIPTEEAVIDKNSLSSALVVEARKQPRETIGQCADKRYKKRNARVQKTLAMLGLASNEKEPEDEEEEYESIPDPDARGELHGEALTQAERAAAARPGVNGRLEDAIESIIARSRVRQNPNLLESRRPDEHYEGEPAGNGRVWRRINDRWATGVQESISVFAPDAAEDCEEPEDDKEEWQEFPWEKLPNPDDVEQDENIPYQPKRRALIRHDDEEDEEPSPPTAASNRASPSGWRPAEQTPRRRQLDSSDTSDEEGAEATRLADQRRKRRHRDCHAARQFIDTMASVESGSKSDGRGGRREQHCVGR